MSVHLKFYLIIWGSSLLLAIFLVWVKRNTLILTSRRYWKFLFEPWKIITFLSALLTITVAAPYSSDHTWDFTDSIIISLLTYALAPWSVATLFRNLKYRFSSAETFVAICFFFVPCWTYDLYILLRDGIYPPTWASNLVLSGGITLMAGLFWNMFWSQKSGLTFAFMLQTWPPSEQTPFRKVFWLCCLIGIPVFLSIAWFVYMYFRE